MGAGIHRLNYAPGDEDRQIKAFLASDAPVRGIMGPVGSGKTTACNIEFMLRAIRQKPSLRDGHRRFRGVIIRETYRDLERTTIPSWLEWVPKEAGKWRGGSSGEPASHHIVAPLNDGTTLDLEVLFIAIQQRAIEDVFRGLYLTAFYINEADRLPIDVLHVGRTRLGRYPSMIDGGPSWYGCWFDLNAPNWGDPLEKFCFSEREEGVEMFVQPSGLSPKAENVSRLPDGYYENQMAGQPDYWIGRFIRNEIGQARDGKPVYPEFSLPLHVSAVSLQPIAKLPIYVSADAGRKPAFTFMQQDAFGQIRILREIVLVDTGARPAGERLAEVAAMHYPRFEIKGVCDPAASQPTETSSDEDDVWMEIVSRTSGIRFRAAPSNKAAMRREAMRQVLSRNITAGRPGLLISGPECEVLKYGLAHGFKYGKRKIGADQYHETPEKNDYSHVCEAAEYGVLELTGSADVLQRLRRQQRGRLPAQVDWQPVEFA